MQSSPTRWFTQPHLIADDNKRKRVYSILDAICRSKYGTDKVRVRQLVSSDELEELSSARIRLYGQRKKYYETLFGNIHAVDEIDSRSFIFALYYEDHIIGTQRVTPAPHEAARYIDPARLRRFVAPGYPDNCVEFSRLIVDKMSPVKGAVDALASTAGAMVALNTSYSQYITYVKPRLQERFSQFSFDRDALLFQIKERGEHHYALFKGNLLTAVIDFFKLDCSQDDLTDMDVFIDLVSRKRLVEAAI
jgi:hypothetical protein